MVAMLTADGVRVCNTRHCDSGKRDGGFRVKASEKSAAKTKQQRRDSELR